MNRKYSLSSDSSLFSNSFSSEAKKRVYNSTKNSDNTKLKKESNNLERLKNKKQQSKYDDTLYADDEKDKNSLETDISANENSQNEKQPKHNFLLEKFLSGSLNQETSTKITENSENQTKFIKPPVPLPRQSKSAKNVDSSFEGSLSDRTFSVASPKVIDINNIEQASVNSDATYNIDYNTEKKMLDAEKSSVSIDNNCVVIPIGDIVIHGSPPNKNLIKVIRNKKTDTNTNEDNSSIDIENLTSKKPNYDTFLGNGIHRKTLNEEENSMELKEQIKTNKKSNHGELETIDTDDKIVTSGNINRKTNEKSDHHVKSILNKNKSLLSTKIKNIVKDKTIYSHDKSNNKGQPNTNENKIKNIEKIEKKYVLQRQKTVKKEIISSSAESTSDDDDIITEANELKIKNALQHDKVSEKEIRKHAHISKDTKDMKSMYVTDSSTEELESNLNGLIKKIKPRENNVGVSDKQALKSNEYVSKNKKNGSETEEDVNLDEEIVYSPEKNLLNINKNLKKSKEISNNKNSTIKNKQQKIEIHAHRGKNKSIEIDDESSDEEKISGKMLNKKEDNTSRKNKKENLSKPLKDMELQDFSTKKKSKSKKIAASKLNASVSSSDQNDYNYEYHIGVVVYKTDHLLLNSFISHPIVKIHFVDSKTGEYLKKSKFNESNNLVGENVEEYLSPMITKAFNLREKRSLVPFWEELVPFYDDFYYILNYKNSVIIFFEILDFLSFQTASLKYNTEGVNSGWYKVAWAFLKPIGKNGCLNTDTKIRLQLYKPKKYNKQKTPRECNIFEWWSSGKWTKYPSTLYVNVKKIKSNNASENNKNDTNNKSEFLLKSNDESSEKEYKLHITEDGSLKGNNNVGQQRIWSRISTQSCKIPNKVLYRLKTGSKGCITMKFNNNGLFLAYSSAAENNHHIIIFNVASNEEYVKFSGHHGIIYDLNWSANDKYLVSASADRTVYIWDIVKRLYSPIQILPHPSFVYCSQFNPKSIEIVTGCYDQTIRIWKSTNDEINSNYNLIQELKGHDGYITSICFLKNGTVFFSSDSVGIVLEWRLNDEDWILKRTLKFRELQNTIINCIVLHPGGKRLFLCCRDSIHRIIDLSVGCIVQWFRGSLNYRLQLTACISPCGSLVIAPSEDGTICIWDADTGVLQTTFTSYTTQIKSNDTIVPHCVQYHPHDHMLAISHHGISLSVLVCVYEKNCIDTKNLILNESAIHKTEENNGTSNGSKKKANRRKEIMKKNDGQNINLETIIEKLDEVIGSARNVT